MFPPSPLQFAGDARPVGEMAVHIVCMVNINPFCPHFAPLISNGKKAPESGPASFVTMNIVKNQPRHFPNETLVFCDKIRNPFVCPGLWDPAWYHFGGSPVSLPVLFSGSLTQRFGKEDLFGSPAGGDVPDMFRRRGFPCFFHESGHTFPYRLCLQQTDPGNFLVCTRPFSRFKINVCSRACLPPLSSSPML